ncbi:MAG: VOC family protein [Alphaproteobacteria bacterium]|nr:VOC family protein [Alphaproteobacteria bacterium]
MTDVAVIGGLHEIGVGVPDLVEGIAVWEAFGYRAGPSGQIGASAAKALYGVDSALRSVRLLHQDADHGLIRLMAWKRPTGPGLNMASLRTVGNRWSVQKTSDIITVANHAETWEDQGRPMNRLGPLLNARMRGVGSGEPEPFRRPITGLRELQIFMPHYQIVIMQRFNLHVPLYGQINEASLMKTSQVCHAGIVVKGGGLAQFDIYEKTFGLKRLSQIKIDHRSARVSRIMFDLREGDRFTIIDFDDVRSEKEHERHRSGRFRIFYLEESSRTEVDRRADSMPGNLGYSLYTYRVPDVAAMRAKILAAGGTAVTPVAADEFGRPAFSFRTPDGFAWTFFTPA